MSDRIHDETEYERINESLKESTGISNKKSDIGNS